MAQNTTCHSELSLAILTPLVSGAVKGAMKNENSLFVIPAKAGI